MQVEITKLNHNGEGMAQLDGKIIFIKKTIPGDIVELTDLTGKMIQYSIYDIFKTNPNDVSVLLPKDELVREVTLITCTNGNKERLILKAKEI